MINPIWSTSRKRMNIDIQSFDGEFRNSFPVIGKVCFQIILGKVHRGIHWAFFSNLNCSTVSNFGGHDG